MNNKQNRSMSMSVVSLIVLVIVTFFTALYMKGLNSGIPLYYDSIGYSATAGGTFVAVFTIASTVMRLFCGQLTDHFPHYKVLLASLVGLLIGVVAPIASDGIAVVMVSRVIQGASFALATNVMTVAVMGTASKKHIGRRVGIKGAGTSLGTMLGALVATFLLDDAGYEGFYIFFAVIILIAIIAVAVLRLMERKEDADAPQAQPSAKTADGAAAGNAAAQSASGSDDSSSRSSSSDSDNASGSDAHSPRRSIREIIAPYLIPSVLPYMAISFARRMPKGFCISFILIYAKHVGIEMGAAFFIAAGATTLLCRLCGGKLFDSGKTWLLLPLVCIQIVGFALLALMPSFPTLIIAAIGYGLSVGTTSPFLKTLTAESAPREHWGVVNGELYFFGDMGKALGAFLGGLIIDAAGKAFVPEIALGFAVITAILTGLALLIGHRRR